MWLSRQGRAAGLVQDHARLGEVTVSGNPAAVYLDGERRALPVFGPGGYCWRPALHQEVLVLKAGDAGETLCVAGARCEEGLEPGEVAISTPGGAAIHLREDGSIEIRGTAFRFNGQDIQPGGM